MQKLLVANYKMNGDKNFYNAIQKVFNKLNLRDTKIILCPPFVYMSLFKIKNKNISVGAQDVSPAINTKSTGQISPLMLKEFNVEYALIGHSERREIGETNELIADKVLTVQENDIKPIVCVGEKNKTAKLDVLREQVKSAISKAKNKEIIFAYEPIWAIGSGIKPTVKRINTAIQMIKETCFELGFNAKVLYGGSVNAENYKEILTSNADGLLMGGVSNKINEFLKIVKGE